MDEPRKRTAAELLAWLREVDPRASLNEHQWGFGILETTALDMPQVLVTNSRAVRQA